MVGICATFEGFVVSDGSVGFGYVQRSGSLLFRMVVWGRDMCKRPGNLLIRISNGADSTGVTSLRTEIRLLAAYIAKADV